MKNGYKLSGHSPSGTRTILRPWRFCAFSNPDLYSDKGSTSDTTFLRSGLPDLRSSNVYFQEEYVVNLKKS